MISAIRASACRDLFSQDALFFHFRMELDQPMDGSTTCHFCYKVPRQEALRVSPDQECNYVDGVSTYIAGGMPFECSGRDRVSIIKSILTSCIPYLRKERKRWLWEEAHPRNKQGRFVKRAA